MQIRLCDKCNRVIGSEENYFSYETKYYNSAGGYNIKKGFELCKQCKEKLCEFLVNGGNKI